MHLVGEGKAKQIRTKTDTIPIQKHRLAALMRYGLMHDWRCSLAFWQPIQAS
jgi:hypothetical protein